MTLHQSPALVPTPGRAVSSHSPDEAAHLDRKPGRPKGTPMPPEWCAALGERSKRNWANPEWRAFILGRMNTGRNRGPPEAEELLSKAARCWPVAG